MNGTFIGEKRLERGAAQRLAIGDTVKLGKTSLVLQFAASGTRPRRLWSHGYFEARLEDECARAEEGGGPFAVARVRVDGVEAGVVAERVLSEIVRPVDVIATYAQSDYEILLVDTPPPAAQKVAEHIEARVRAEGLSPEVTIACYPRDGRTPESLVARSAKKQAAWNPEDPVVRTGALARLEPLVDKIAPGSISVLVLGETGVGKEVLARMLHERSPRAGKTLVCLNCASLSETLLESELFGHEKGAFTGAVAAKVGLLESANGGTVFLDEVGEMPLSLQAKLLRVLEQREVLRVGAVRPRAIDVRFVAATNRDLEQEIVRGRFRQDLYYRLNGFSLVIPPLRQRADEIEPLARHFISLSCRQLRRKPLDIAPDAVEALLAYEWPGNIRELKNAIDRAVLLASGRSINAQHLPHDRMVRALSSSDAPPASVRPRARTSETTKEMEIPSVSFPFGTTARPPASAPQSSHRDGEKERIIAALEQCAGNQTQAAKLLGVSRQTLVTRIETYNLPRPRKQ